MGGWLIMKQWHTGILILNVPVDPFEKSMWASKYACHKKQIQCISLKTCKSLDLDTISHAHSKEPHCIINIQHIKPHNPAVNYKWSRSTANEKYWPRKMLKILRHHNRPLMWTTAAGNYGFCLQLPTPVMELLGLLSSTSTIVGQIHLPLPLISPDRINFILNKS